MTPLGPLLLAAALVGILPMSAPDHWVTLIILGRSSRWSRSRLLGVGAVTAIGHVILSVLLGFAIVGVGMVFPHVVSLYLTDFTGAVMIVAGLFFGTRTLLSHGEVDYEKEAEEGLAPRLGLRRGMPYFAVLGAALSPDLSILPIFLLVVLDGLGAAVETAFVFATASILSLVLLVLVGSMGLGRAFERIPPKYNDALVGFVIAAVGAYILLAG